MVDIWYTYYNVGIFFSKTFFYLPYHTGSKLEVEWFSFRVPCLSFKVFVKRFH